MHKYSHTLWFMDMHCLVTLPCTNTVTTCGLWTLSRDFALHKYSHNLWFMGLSRHFALHKYSHTLWFMDSVS